MSDTFDNPRDRRKHAQEMLSAAAHYSGVAQQIVMGTLYQSAGRSGLSSADKLNSINAMREAVKVAMLNVTALEQALVQATEDLDKASEMYSQQVSQETSLEAVDTPEDFLKLIDPKS
jgi:hypothetical protein